MSPHDLSSPTSPSMDPEEIRHRRMIKRSKVIEELVRTEGDYQKDLDLCIREVLLPLREAQARSLFLKRMYLYDYSIYPCIDF